MRKTGPRAVAKGNPAPRNPARRHLLNGLWLGLGGIAMAEALWLAISFIKPRTSDRRPEVLPTVLDAGPAAQFAPGTVTAFPQGRFYLARLADGGFLALSRRCTHLGCTLPWDPEKGLFACPCHASVFNIHGEVVRSPAPRPLDHFPVAVENGRVRVNISRLIRRQAFSKDQVAYE